MRWLKITTNEISNHTLVPIHTKLSDKEKKEFFEAYKITVEELPRINAADPAISHLDPKADDVIKVERPSPTAKTTEYYRRVIK